MFGRGSAQCGYQVTEDDGTKSSSEFLESASCIPRGSTGDRPWRGLGAQEGKSTVKPTVEPSPPSSGKVLNGDCPGQVNRSLNTSRWMKPYADPPRLQSDSARPTVYILSALVGY
ncbi:hypothetical protein POX_f07733 [Penicillium oxalicum]|uniref:hypothetical protein n=1 Tax=Penicillium oxalicum TaxID=69781 RepID=UPI0020B7EB82|nr:hypothetical protein POX_f07733 [Penicillium oxalicum]KAI2787369.1 hypothetical protein POX_f07733 [Penicillium oxalicum]